MAHAVVREQIDEYLGSLPEAKRSDLRALHDAVLRLLPGCRLWFVDGKDVAGRVVSNPSVGYGLLRKTYANGTARDFYQVGISANTSGISVYLFGLDDRTYLPRLYGGSIGKANITGYCVKFRKLSDIDVDVLVAAIQDVIRQTTA